MRSTESKIKWLACVLFAFIAVVAMLPYLTNHRVEDTLADLKSTAAEERDYQLLLSLLVDAETGQRGFIITGNDDFLQPYHAAVRMLDPLAAALHEELRSPAERAALRAIQQHADRRLAYLAGTIALRREHGYARAAAVVASGAGKAHMDVLRKLIGRRLALLAERRNQLRADLGKGTRDAMYISAAVNIVEVLLLTAALVVGMRALRARQAAERLAQRHADELQAMVAAADLRNVQLEVCAEMLHALECVSTLDETSGIIATFCRKLLPEVSGSLYLFGESRELLARRAAWGEQQGEQRGEQDGGAAELPADDCWAVRRGMAHFCLGEHDLRCKHGGHAHPQVCIPLVTQDAVLGFISLQAEDAQALQRQRALLRTLGEEVSIAISNVQLRETLRLQSIVDPLTGLYNRRYLDETIKRELLRAQRHAAPLALVVLDLDHFKRINDTHGHDGGDAVLRAVAAVLQDSVRECDVVCRFGGEEMVALLPGCEQGAAAERAELIRARIAALRVSFSGQEIRPTASLGVAAFPQDGGDGQALFGAADAALYEAKRRGRNRVSLAAPRLHGAAAIESGGTTCGSNRL